MLYRNNYSLANNINNLQMNNLIEKINYRGYTIEIFYDKSADSPANWGNEDAFLVYQHRDFCIRREGFGPYAIFTKIKTKKALYNGYFAFCAYAYIHSGISLSLGRQHPFDDNWDVSTTGYVLVKRQKGWTWTREKAFSVAKSIIEEWNMYLSGDVYRYNSEAGGACGYYGKEGKEQMIKEAKAEIDYEIEALAIKESYKMLNNFILDKPLSFPNK
jgi:hypothetical protein